MQEPSSFLKDKKGMWPHKIQTGVDIERRDNINQSIENQGKS